VLCTHVVLVHQEILVLDTKSDTTTALIDEAWKVDFNRKEIYLSGTATIKGLRQDGVVKILIECHCNGAGGC
jgi:hypothetical protein